MQPVERILQIFLIKEDKKDGHLEAVSNRELVWRWIGENGYTCMMDIPGKPPIIIKSYAALCRLWSTTHVIDVYMCQSGSQPVAYKLIKMQVRRK